jgi:hypothetical protein
MDGFDRWEVCAKSERSLLRDPREGGSFGVVNTFTAGRRLSFCFGESSGGRVVEARRGVREHRR